MTIPRLTRTAFRKYLEANQDKEFGRGSCSLCPVAWFFWDGIKGELDDLDVHVTGCRIWLEGPANICRPLAPWARSFVRKFDAAPNARMTGREALAVLDQV